MSFNLMYIVRLICTIQYIRGGQVGTFINEGERRESQTWGQDIKKETLRLVQSLVDRGERVDRWGHIGTYFLVVLTVGVL
jgi:hypothetical protein